MKLTFVRWTDLVREVYTLQKEIVNNILNLNTRKDELISHKLQ